MDKIIISPSMNSYTNVLNYLTTELNFKVLETEHVCGGGTEYKLKSKKEMFLGFFKHSKIIFKERKELSGCKIIISIGILDSLFVLLLNKLRIIRPKRIFWWGFFIHSPKMQKLFGNIIRPLILENVKIIVFSECETEMYEKAMKIPDKVFVYLPYGNWNPEISEQQNGELGNYFFAGGYSNRDYKSLIEAWKSIEYKLIIIGSANNRDLVEYRTDKNNNNNIEVILDVESSVFDSYLSGARACILPFKFNTGASGQSVALRCMRLGKVMISTNTDVMREYIQNGITGLIVENLETDLADALETVVKNEVLVNSMIQESKKLYETKFSYEAITRQLKNILK